MQSLRETATTKPHADIRDLLAAERTFLAWIRTGLALMGFGFVVARFGLFLREFQSLQHIPVMPSTRTSLWFGVALIALGVLVNVFSAAHHRRLVRQLNSGAPPSPRASSEAIFIALFLAAVGVAMAVYLLFVHSSTIS